MPEIMEGENELEKCDWMEPIDLVHHILSKEDLGDRVKFTTLATLELSHCNLQEVPPCIKMLKLKELKLSHNILKVVPICLYTGLESLECLDLSYNMLTSFEIEPACCPVLKRLVVNHNHIKDFPQWILVGQAPNITDVVYSNNEIMCLRISTHKPNLETLELASCLMRDDDFYFLTKLTKLKKLVIGNLTADTKDKRANYFRDHSLEKFFSHFFVKNLEVLNLNHLSVSMIPRDLFWNELLVELHLVNCDLFVITSDIKYLTKLEVLDISYNSLSKLPEELVNLKELRVLKAPCNILDVAPKFKSKLEILDLYDNRLITFPETIYGLPSAIDLEQNFVCTSSSELYSQYCEAKTKLRKMFGFNDRSDSFRNLEKFRYTTSSSSLSSEEYEQTYQEIGHFQDFNKFVENWDEELDILENKKVQRHPDVSQSDDEWNALEPVLKYRPRRKVKPCFPPDPDEDWIFCDVQC